MKHLALPLAFLLFFLLPPIAHAQKSDVELFVDDMLKIADDFATPAAEGAAYQAGAGWFTSAEGLEQWEVDLSVHTNVLFIPGSKKSNHTTSNDYATFDIAGADQATIPSAFGGATDVTFEGEIDFMGNSLPFSFEAIDGIDKSALMHPFIQASVGVPFDTEVTLRFLPQVEIDGVNFSTYGAGIKHNFNQYFRFSQPTDFQFAALVAYSKFDVNYAFTPVVVSGVVELNEIEVDADLWLLQLITSKRFRDKNWSAFGAIGITNSNFVYKAGGSGLALDPMNAALATLSNDEMEFKGDLGVNYEIGNILISSMFSQGKFSNLNFSLHYRL